MLGVTQLNSVVSVTMTKVQQIQPAEIEKIVGDKKNFILDVRTPPEFAQVSLPRAHLIPVQVFESRTAELPKDKSTPILVYCAHGRRSMVACHYLTQLGYTNLMNLVGGIAALHGE